MKKVFLTYLLLYSCLPLFCKDRIETLLTSLDSLLELKDAKLQNKFQELESIKRNAADLKGEDLLRLYDDLYQEYYVLQFDSAMTYVDKGLKLSEATGNDYYKSLNHIYKAELLAIGGLYSQAVETLDALHPDQLDVEMRFSYYICLFRIYSYWSDFCNDSEYSPVYREKAKQYLQAAMPNIDYSDRRYEYYMGEYSVYVLGDAEKARYHYLRAMRMIPKNTRTHAMTCFALYGNYNSKGQTEEANSYLIQACISDVESNTMENFALQNLATSLFGQGKNKENLERAQRYISISLSDAKFYNNRLRIIEVSANLPMIVRTYQNMLDQRNKSLTGALAIISFLVVFLLGSVLFIFKQNKKLARRHHELKVSNAQLTELNDRQNGLNTQLNMLNEKLLDTNRKREGLAKIYIDLCSKYIDKFKKQQTLVKRKIMANQSKELLTMVSTDRLSEADTNIFNQRFDKAFLELYPNFIDEFNRLLQPHQQIIVKDGQALTVELRIYALIRLGVKESCEIAGLLSYSPQTIYNYRSVIKAKALNRDTFEDDVRSLCAVIV